MTNAYETVLQTRPVCPHCGHAHDDAWEWSFDPSGDGTSRGCECERCGEEFDCDRVVDVSYTTRKTFG